MAEKAPDKVNILLVDDQPAKLLSYEVILRDLGENLIKAHSAREALEVLLKTDVAVLLVDVCMPELDGFQLAAMIREHPRFHKTAIIFISAIHLTDMDRLRGYEMGAVDYVPVPVIPDVLRAKVRIFTELYRKTRQLEALNRELEDRVRERTAELEQSTERLRESERRRTLALAAGQMGAWDLDVENGDLVWDEGHARIFGVNPGRMPVTLEVMRQAIEPEDWPKLAEAYRTLARSGGTYQSEFRVRRPDGEIRWCLGTATATPNEAGRITRVSGVTIDITERKHAEEMQTLLAREVDHRARNALAVAQSIVRLTRAPTIEGYIAAVEGRIKALARVHSILSQSRWQGADLKHVTSEELAPFRTGHKTRVSVNGPMVMLEPATAQTLALALHEMATNAAKYGALSVDGGELAVSWTSTDHNIVLEWVETSPNPVPKPTSNGFGTKVITTSIEQQLRGSVTFDWEPHGLRCTLSFPRAESDMARQFVALARAPESEAEPTGGRLAGTRRVMLVEDEVLVSMLMERQLSDLGVKVVGPFDTAAAAIGALHAQMADGAILDINLKGGLAYSVADELRARNLPFVFVTGYDTHSIDGRFKDIPILQKPIDRSRLESLFKPPSGPPGQGEAAPADTRVRTVAAKAS